VGYYTQCRAFQVRQDAVLIADHQTGYESWTLVPLTRKVSHIHMHILLAIQAENMQWRPGLIGKRYG
jgi:hypothetical protein